MKILERQIKNGTLPHAYLFSGADEEAKNGAIEFILINILGVDWKRSLDLLEIAGDPITIDEIRAIKSRAYSAPIASAKNIFVIRNIETLSRDAAPALLKILEDPPKSLLILATTSNRNLLLQTIKSRFPTLNFYKKSDSDMRRFEEKARETPNLINLKCFEEALWVKRALTDPTINKRLLNEYLTMLAI